MGPAALPMVVATPARMPEPALTLTGWASAQLFNLGRTGSSDTSRMTISPRVRPRLSLSRKARVTPPRTTPTSTGRTIFFSSCQCARRQYKETAITSPTRRYMSVMPRASRGGNSNATVTVSSDPSAGTPPLMNPVNRATRPRSNSDSGGKSVKTGAAYCNCSGMQPNGSMDSSDGRYSRV